MFFLNFKFRSNQINLQFRFKSREHCDSPFRGERYGSWAEARRGFSMHSSRLVQISFFYEKYSRLVHFYFFFLLAFASLFSASELNFCADKILAFAYFSSLSSPIIPTKLHWIMASHMIATFKILALFTAPQTFPPMCALDAFSLETFLSFFYTGDSCCLRN